jgi:hypothetical protein
MNGTIDTSRLKYPFHDMEVGDRVEYDFTDKRGGINARTRAQRVGEQYDKHFKCVKGVIERVR